MDASRTSPPRRADARRNYEALLAAGRAVFGRLGVDAPLEEVAKEAGVGQGTLYRHFPTRDHLFAALMNDAVEALETRASELRDAEDGWRALGDWLRLYRRSAVRYRGMSTRIGDGLVEEGSAMAHACAPMKAAFAELFAKAQTAGLVRRDVSAVQVLTLVAGIPGRIDPEVALGIVLRGIRAD